MAHRLWSTVALFSLIERFWQPCAVRGFQGCGENPRFRSSAVGVAEASGFGDDRETMERPAPERSPRNGRQDFAPQPEVIDLERFTDRQRNIATR